MLRERYYSLDVFRGATVALMILVNNQVGERVYTPLDHAPWNGCTPTDLVFPFFLFAVGNAFSFVLPRFQERGTTYFLGKVFKRAFLIFLIGFLMNWSPFVQWQGDHLVLRALSTVRIMGVLQRIALCYLFAALLLYFLKPKGAFLAVCAILLLYWWACYAFGTPGSPYSRQGYFGLPIDRFLFGEPHMYKENGVIFDPEGLMSTFPAIGNVVFGYFVGHYIQTKGKTYEMLSNLFVAGVVFVLAGLCWDLVFPINKRIWTSSYVVFTSGLAMLLLGVLVFSIEFKGHKGAWSRFCDVFGKNPLFIFICAGFLPRLQRLIRIPDHSPSTGQAIMTSPLGWFYNHICYPISTDVRNDAVVYALSLVALYWLFAWWLDRKKVYIKV